MPCIMTHKVVSNKTFPRQLSIQKNTCKYKMMMQLKVVAVWVFLLVSIVGLTEGGALDRPQRNAPTGNRVNSLNTSSLPYIEILRGRDGRDGRDGVPGPRGPQGQRGVAGATGAQGPPGPSSGGVVYTRRGKTTCPNVSGTELVYAGRAGGSRYNHRGGAANYLCTPGDPDYLCYQSGVQGYSDVYGVDYQPHSGPLSAIHEHNAPCAVCYASMRVVVKMISSKTRCPMTWTPEYSGYLMSAASLYGHHNRTMYECVDKNPDSVPGGATDTNPAFFYDVEANCNGMACPRYDPLKELTCAVCTK